MRIQIVNRWTIQTCFVLTHGFLIRSDGSFDIWSIAYLSREILLVLSFGVELLIQLINTFMKISSIIRSWSDQISWRISSDRERAREREFLQKKKHAMKIIILRQSHRQFHHHLGRRLLSHNKQHIYLYIYSSSVENCFIFISLAYALQNNIQKDLENKQQNK